MSSRKDERSKRQIKLPRSVVYMEEFVSQIVDESLASPISFVKAPELYGKSTLLNQIGLRLRADQMTVVSVNFNHPIDLVPALSRLVEALGMEIPEERFYSRKEADQKIELLERIATHLDQTECYLLIDNLDHLSAFQDLVNFFLRSLQQGRIIATLGNLPSLEPTKLLDCCIFHYQGLETKHIAKLLIQLKLCREDQEDLPEISESMLEASRGNPYVLKTLLSPFVVSGKSINIQSIQDQTKEARVQYIKKLEQSLSPQTHQWISMASIVQFDEALEDSILSLISTKDFQYLEDLGFVVFSGDKKALTKDVKAYFAKDQSHKTRRKILEYMDQPKSSFDCKERIWILHCLGETQDCLTILEQNAYYLLSRAEYTFILNITDRYLDRISVEMARQRCFILRNLGKTNQSFQEMERLIAKGLPEKNRSDVLLSAARGALVEGRSASAEKYLKTIAGNHSNNSPEYFKAQMTLGLHYNRIDQKKAEEIANHGKQFLSSRETVEDDLLIYYFNFLAAYYEETCQYRKAIEAYQQCSQVSHRLGKIRQELFCSYSSAVLSYDLGELNEARRKILEIEKLASKYLLEEALNIRYFKSNLLRYDGRIEESIFILHQSYSKKALHLRGIGDLKNMLRSVPGYLLQGNYKKAHEILRESMQMEACKNYKELYLFSKKTMDLVDFYSQRGPTLRRSILRQIENSGLKSEIRLRFLNTAMELNLQSFFCLDLCRQIDAPKPEGEIIIEFDSQLEYDFLSGAHYLFFGLKEKSLKRLENSLRRSEEAGYKFYQFRNLIYLAALDISSGMHKEALKRLEHAGDFEQYVPRKEELDQWRCLKSLCLLALDQIEIAKDIASKIDSESIYQFILSKAFEQRKVEWLLPTVELDSLQKKFVNRWAKLLMADQIEAFSLCRNGRVEHSLSSDTKRFLKERGYDLILHLNSGLCRIGQIQVNLSKKQRLLSCLDFLLKHRGKYFSKEELTIFVWHEKYNPLVHDNRIYTTMNRLRSIIKSCIKKEVIQVFDSKYGIRSEIRFLIIQKQDELEDLNERQKWMLQYLAANPSMDRKTAQEILNSSSSVLKRDLKTLAERGLIISYGEGRSIRYKRA